MKRKGKRIMWIFLGVVLFIVAMCLIAVVADAPCRNEIKALTFSEVSFDNLKDGTYVGEYVGTKSHVRDAKVEVTVANGTITEVKILKGAINKEGQPIIIRDGKTITNLLDNVIQEKSLEIDVISGATITSKAHMKAFENALKQAQK